MNKKIVLLRILLVMTAAFIWSCKEKDSSNIVIEGDSRNDTESVDAVDELYVYVVGEVLNPGVYILSFGSRVNDAVNAAGGFTDYAARDCINLAKKVSDGEKIIVYSISQVDNNEIMTDGGNGLVNINTAGVSELMTLPGIGESRANDIIKYREKNGGFNSKEDIMKVSGIKKAAFEKIEDMITVN